MPGAAQWSSDSASLDDAKHHWQRMWLALLCHKQEVAPAQAHCAAPEDPQAPDRLQRRIDVARAAAAPAPGAGAAGTQSGAGLSSGSESPEERRSSRRERSRKGRKEKRSKRSKRSRDREDRERERDRTAKKAKPTQDGKVGSSCRHHCLKGLGSPHTGGQGVPLGVWKAAAGLRGQGSKRTQGASLSRSTAGAGTTPPARTASALDVLCCCSAS